MAVLISVPGPKVRRVCGSRCHNAKHPACYCICGGLNHQAGLQAAIENTRILRETLQMQYPDVRFSKEVLQLELKEEA